MREVRSCNQVTQKRVGKTETVHHNRQGKRVALNRMPESLARMRAAPTSLTVVDGCHSSLVQIQGLVDKTVRHAVSKRQQAHYRPTIDTGDEGVNCRRAMEADRWIG